MRRTLLALACVLALLPAAAWAQTAPTVFAAASLTDAMRDVAAAWSKAGHAAPKLSFGASSTLARQIEQGAPADLFASADERWMDYLAQRNLLAEGTRRDLLGNDLVLIVPANAARRIDLAHGFDAAAVLGANGRLATGDPAHVPVGIYAEQALRRLGAWDAVSGRLARTEDVRAALLLVERGEAPAGIVYATDAAVASGVAVAGTFPESSHDPVTYPFAITRDGGGNAEARALMAFLSGPEARAIFARRGFKVE